MPCFAVPDFAIQERDRASRRREVGIQPERLRTYSACRLPSRIATANSESHPAKAVVLTVTRPGHVRGHAREAISTAGSLYIVTGRGGNSGGRTWKMVPDWAMQVSSSANSPLGPIVWDANGALYGTAYEGGGPLGYGTAFEIVP